MTAPGTALAAALLQITQQAERTVALEEKVAGNFRHTDTTLASMSGAIAKLTNTVDSQAQVLRSLDGLNDSVELLAAQVAGLLPPPDGEPDHGYTPRPPVHWWSLKDEERRKAVTRLAAWVEQVWRPHYGHLAATLSSCWEEHPLILVQLDWLSELHSVLYFQPKRTAALLSAQAEFGTRIVPAVSEQFRVETSRCRHRQPAASENPWAGTR